MPAALTDAVRHRIQQDARSDPSLSQRTLAKRYGVSQSEVSKLLREPPVPPPTPLGLAPVLQLADPPSDRYRLPPKDDLELRIRELDQLAADSAAARAFGPAVQAKATAAKLRRELDELRASEPEEEDLTPEYLTDAVMALSDELVPVCEAALARRREEGRR